MQSLNHSGPLASILLPDHRSDLFVRELGPHLSVLWLVEQNGAILGRLFDISKRKQEPNMYHLGWTDRGMSWSERTETGAYLVIFGRKATTLRRLGGVPLTQPKTGHAPSAVLF